MTRTSRMIALVLALSSTAAQSSLASSASLDEELHGAAVREIAAGHAPKALALIDKAIAAREEAKAPEDLRLADLLREKILLSFDTGTEAAFDELAEKMLKILVRYRAYDDSVDFQGPALSVASELERHDRPSTALKLLEAARRFSPHPPFVEVRIAQARCKLGDCAKARRNLSVYFGACEKHPKLCGASELARAHLTAGDIDLGLRKLESADEHFAAIAELAPEERAALPAAVRALAEQGRGETTRLSGHPTAARAFYQRALKEAAAEPGDPSLRALVLGGLARAASDEGNWPEAEKTGEEAHAIRQARAGASRSAALEAAVSAALLGGIKLRLGKLDEAQKLLSAAQGALGDKAGAETPDSLMARYQLALLAHAHGEHERARSELARLIPLCDAKLGQSAPQSALMRLAAAKLELDQDNLFEAEALLRQAQAHARKGGAEAAEASHWLGITKMRRGDYAAAAKQLDSATQAYRRLQGKDTPAFARAELALGESLTRSRGLKKARAILEDALADTPAKDEAAYASAETGLGELLLETNHPKRAGELFQSALDLSKKVYGERHPLAARNLAGLGRALAMREGAEKGIPLLEQAVALREAAQPSDSWAKAEDYLHLAELYEKAGKNDRAIAAYSKSLETFRRSYLPEFPPQIQRAVDGAIRARNPSP